MGDSLWGVSLFIHCFIRKFVKNILWVFLSSMTEGIEGWKGKWKERLIGDFSTRKAPSFPIKLPYLLVGDVPWRGYPAIVLLLQNSFTRNFSHSCPRWENCKRNRAFQNSEEQERKGKQRRGENHPRLTCCCSLPSFTGDQQTSYCEDINFMEKTNICPPAV